jgi:hypothetical protein
MSHVPVAWQRPAWNMHIFSDISALWAECHISPCLYSSLYNLVKIKMKLHHSPKDSYAGTYTRTFTFADSPALPVYFSGSETREYAPVLRIPGDRCAAYYRSDPPGYSDPAPDRKTDLPDTCPCTPIPRVFISPNFYQAAEEMNSICSVKSYCNHTALILHRLTSCILLYS